MAVQTTGLVAIRDLTKRYGTVEALRGVSLEIAPGNIFGLLGPNGAGKTTLLECVLGLRRPDSGAILLDGLDPQRDPARARAAVGAQLQAAALPDAITPREALAFFASFYARPAAVEPLLERFGLGDRADARCSALSGGQRQRLFLALALVNEPRVVLLDEPTVGLDVAARREFHALLRTLRAEGRTVIFSTHYLEEAAQLCDQLVILHEGRLLATGRPADLVARAGACPQVRVRTARALDPAVTRDLPGVNRCRTEDTTCWLTSDDTGATISVLLSRLKAADNALLDLQILQPSLEDAFVALTGRTWTEPAGPEDGA